MREIISDELIEGDEGTVTVTKMYGDVYKVEGLAEIDTVPTIKCERKQGKWVKVPGYATPGGDPVWCCSECGKGLHVYGIEHGTYGADVADGQWKACPNCGVEMKGE